jgi:hypothetical protein
MVISASRHSIGRNKTITGHFALDSLCKSRSIRCQP